MRPKTGRHYARKSRGENEWWEVVRCVATPPDGRPVYRYMGGFMTEECARLWAEKLNKEENTNITF